MNRAQNFAKWYFSFDPKDIWNWVLLVASIFLFWWGIKTILATVTLSP